MKFESDDVARYYERNTPGFLARGQGGSLGVIHRAVWADGVTSRDQAFHHVHDVLRRRAEEMGASRVLDLGCGTGASLERVGARAEEILGVTNSHTHAALARERLGSRAIVFEQDFCSTPLPDAVDLAYGIESFVQAPSAEAFFDNVGRALSSGGCLALCDDFLESDRSHPLVATFRHGWQATSLLAPREVDAIAATSELDLIEDRDWTDFLELDRPRDRLLRAYVALLQPFAKHRPRFRSLAGGSALRMCLKRGLVRYRYRVWRKR